MSILCATDFSPRCAHGVHTASLLASRLHDTAELIHVLPPMDGELPSPAVADEIRRTSQERLEEEASHLRKDGVEVHTHVLLGPVAEVLDRFAAEEKPQLLVLSAVGRTAPEEWLLGSTTERTVGRVHAPTLVVRNSVPFEVWTRGERALRVLVACDFTLSSRAALCWARKLAEIGPCEFMVARVVWLYDVGAQPDSDATDITADGQPGPYEAVVRNLTEWVRPFIGDLNPEIHCLTSLGRPDFRLIEFAEQNRIDLIVTGSRQQHGLQRIRSGSFSRGLLRYAPMNVACVPLTGAETVMENRLPTIERVLVATDFSDPSDRAILMGCSIVGQGGKLRLLSVVRPGHNGEAEETRSRLQAHLPPITAELNIDTDIAVVTATDIATAICDDAERFDAQLICVGTRGADGFSVSLLGSVAHAVAARSRRPVLLAPHIPE